MNNNKQLTRLENLPDEIFLYEIFPLFSWEELYYTFFNLNQRLNNILQSSKHLSFTVNTTNKCHPALAFFAPCIACLTICLGHFDVTPFLALRSLTLQYPSLQQRNSIRPENFPLLEYLNLSYPLEDSILLNLIFSNAFKHLKKCKFDRILATHFWNGSPKLRSLSIIVCDPYGVICVLRACPNICRLNIIVDETSQAKLSLPRHSISCMNSNLRYLIIRSTFQMLISILTLTPNLKRLTFDDIARYFGRSSEYHFKQLINSLSILKQLSHLHLTIASSAWNEHRTFHSLHPLFKHVEYVRPSAVVVYGSIV